MRASAIRLVLAFGIVFMALVGGAAAQELNKQQRSAVNKFAANNSLFVLYHEVAHLLVHQLNLPVLGKEEDAADNMATWTLLNKNSKEADQALADAAYGWILSGLTYGTNLDDSDYYAAHSLDRQRAFQIVCLMVGSDDTSFKPIANQYEIDGDRQDSCYWDYDLVNRSFRGLLGARSNKSGNGTDVTVTYHTVTGTLKRAADAFKASGIFDQVANELRDNYNIPETVTFSAKRCGEANAFYDPETVEVIFCYEMMADFMDMYIKDMPAKAKQGAPHPTGLGRIGTESM